MISAVAFDCLLMFQALDIIWIIAISVVGPTIAILFLRAISVRFSFKAAIYAPSTGHKHNYKI